MIFLVFLVIYFQPTSHDTENWVSSPVDNYAGKVETEHAFTVAYYPG